MNVGIVLLAVGGALGTILALIQLTTTEFGPQSVVAVAFIVLWVAALAWEVRKGKMKR